MQIVGGQLQIVGGQKIPMMWISTKDAKVEQLEIDPPTFALARSFAEGNTSTAVVSASDGVEILFKEARFLFPEPKRTAPGRGEMPLPMFTLLSPFLGATWKGDAIAGGEIAGTTIQVSSVWQDIVTIRYPTGPGAPLYRVSHFFASTRSGELSPRTSITFEQVTPRDPVSFDLSGTPYRVQTVVFAQGPAGLEGAQRGDQLEKVEVAPELARRMRWSLQAIDDTKTIHFLSELRLGSVAARCAVYEGGLILPYSAASRLRESLDQQGAPALRLVYPSALPTGHSAPTVEYDAPKGMEWKRLGTDSVLILKGFPYQRTMALLLPESLTVDTTENGSLKFDRVLVSEQLDMGGGLRAEVANTAVNITWHFAGTGASFRHGGFVYTTTSEDASITFTPDGVLAKGFHIAAEDTPTLTDNKSRP